MPHTYECPMRWADMDLLGHVNNVTYLQYVAEARAALLGDGPARAAAVRRHRVQFVAPLVFRREPVLVDSWVSAAGDGDLSLEHEVYDELAGRRTTYLRASTDLAMDAGVDPEGLPHGDPQEWRPVERGEARARSTYDVSVRLGDLDAAGRASDVVHVEYFQEARIRYLMDLHTRGQRWSHQVVATTELDLLAPVVRRRKPYVARSWVAHLGRRSFSIASDLVDPLDGDRVLATAAVVLVAFDKETQRPADMADAQRERLAAELEGR